MVVFDETVFPFSQLTSPSPPQSSTTPKLHSDQFVDAAHPPTLLANHGAGHGRGARLELLDDASPPPGHVGPSIDVHGADASHASGAGDLGPATPSSVASGSSPGAADSCSTPTATALFPEPASPASPAAATPAGDSIEGRRPILQMLLRLFLLHDQSLGCNVAFDSRSSA